MYESVGNVVMQVWHVAMTVLVTCVNTNNSVLASTDDDACGLLPAMT